MNESRRFWAGVIAVVFFALGAFCLVAGIATGNEALAISGVSVLVVMASMCGVI